MNKRWKIVLLGTAVFLLMIYTANSIILGPGKIKPLSYTAFVTEVQHHNVKSVQIAGVEILGQTKDGKAFSTTTPPEVPDLSAMLVKNNVDVNAVDTLKKNMFSYLMPYVPFIFIMLLMFVVLKSMQGGGNSPFSFGKSRAKVFDESHQKVTFADVAGVDEAKQELSEVVEFLKFPKKFISLGARIPKGILLLGPPGSGKTLLARAIAGEAGVPFYSISGSDFVEMFVGVGASRVRSLFEQAKKTSPCIVFIDEIDAVGRQRGAGMGGGHDEREQTLNQLLVEMDGFEQNSGVILIAATNRADVLDAALLRPGRFDRQVVVDRADVRGRQAILAVHAKNKPFADDVSIEILAKRTPGFSGADLENLLNEAALLAARQNKTVIEMHDCNEAIDRVMVGPERKSLIMSQQEKEITAYHESGHAVVGGLTPNSDPVHKVTIIPRGMALGITWSMPDEDRHSQTKNQILAVIKRLVAGRLAEEIKFGDVTTGASNDFEKATELARRMVTQYGMSDTLGPLQYGKADHQPFAGRGVSEDRNYSEDIAMKIDIEVRKIIDVCYTDARNILETNWHMVERMATSLLENETVDASEVLAILANKPWPNTPPISGKVVASPVKPTGERILEKVINFIPKPNVNPGTA